MTYDTINAGEATPLKIQGGYSDDATGVAPSSTKKSASSSIVRTMLVGTAVAVGVFLLMAGPSKMMTTMNKSSNVDGMVSNLQTPYVTYTNWTPNPTRVSGIYPIFCLDVIISAGTKWTASQGECLPKTIVAEMDLVPERKRSRISTFPCDTCYVTN